MEFLNIAENMNEGKTYSWFEYALKKFGQAAYIAKMDQDAFINPHSLVKQLTTLPEKNLFYGFDCGHNGIRRKIGSYVKSEEALSGYGHHEAHSSPGGIKRPMLFFSGWGNKPTTGSVWCHQQKNENGVSSTCVFLFEV